MRLLFNDFLSKRPVEHEDVRIDPEYPIPADSVAVLVHVDHATLTFAVTLDQQVWLLEGGAIHDPPKLIGLAGVLV